MNSSLEIKALGWAILAATLSLGLAALLAGAIQMTAGPDSTAAASQPVAMEVVATPELIAEGHKFFGESCSHCHGDDATGDEGPNLHHLAISNARIAKTIKNGVKGEMPTFAKKYDDKQIAALIAFLRTLK